MDWRGNLEGNPSYCSADYCSMDVCGFLQWLLWQLTSAELICAIHTCKGAARAFCEIENFFVL